MLVTTSTWQQIGDSHHLLLLGLDYLLGKLTECSEAFMFISLLKDTDEESDNEIHKGGFLAQELLSLVELGCTTLLVHG